MYMRYLSDRQRHYTHCGVNMQAFGALSDTEYGEVPVGTKGVEAVTYSTAVMKILGEQMSVT